jgi:NAD(P)H-hydrate epimerase
MNESDATVLSVDVPSGLDCAAGALADNAVDADHVVTFHDTKPGLDALAASVTVADIGIPDAAECFVESGDLTRLSRDPASHKGDNGEVLIVGGGPYTGAPALSAQAALRAGADLVRVAAPETVAREIQGYSENLIVHAYEGDRLTPAHIDWLADRAADHDTLVLGPGLGSAETTLDAVGALLERFEGTAVVDADALQVVPEIETGAELVCTPHQGELLTMGGETSDDWRERADLVERFAADIGHTLLVKGPDDVISDGERTRISRTGNAGMTVGGTGDVLAGVTGALSCVLEPHHAAAVAAYANGAAGDVVVEERGSGLAATDLLDAVPGVLWD